MKNHFELWDCEFEAEVQELTLGLKFPVSFCVLWKTFESQQKGSSSIESTKMVQSSRSVTTFAQKLKIKVPMLYDIKKKLFLKKEGCLEVNMLSKAHHSQVKMVGRITIDLTDICSSKREPQSQIEPLQFCPTSASLSFAVRILEKERCTDLRRLENELYCSRISIDKENGSFSSSRNSRNSKSKHSTTSQKFQPTGANRPPTNGAKSGLKQKCESKLLKIQERLIENLMLVQNENSHLYSLLDQQEQTHEEILALLDEKNQEIDSLATENSNLKEQLTQKSTAFQTLRSELTKTAKAKGNSQLASNVEIISKNQQLTTEICRLKQELASNKNVKSEQLNSKVKKVEFEVDEKDDHILKLKKKMSQLSQNQKGKTQANPRIPLAEKNQAQVKTQTSQSKSNSGKRTPSKASKLPTSQVQATLKGLFEQRQKMEFRDSISALVSKGIKESKNDQTKNNVMQKAKKLSMNWLKLKTQIVKKVKPSQNDQLFTLLKACQNDTQQLQSATIDFSQNSKDPQKVSLLT